MKSMKRRQESPTQKQARNNNDETHPATAKTFEAVASYREPTARPNSSSDEKRMAP